MNILENLSSNQKNLIKDIVREFKKHQRNFKKDPVNSLPLNGILLNQCFSGPFYIIKPGFYENKVILKIEFISKRNGNLSAYRQQMYEDRMESFLQVQFIERLCFIKKLWENNLIFLVGASNSGLPIFTKNDFGLNNKYKSSTIPSEFNFQEYIDFLVEYYNAQLIPSSSLLGFKKRHYITNEQLRTYIAILVSILIGIVSPILMTKCSKTTIDNAQYNGIINSIPTVPEYPKEIIINQNQVDTIISIINTNNK